MIIRTTKRFERQTSAARTWWLQNRDKAPEAFDEALARALELLLTMPYAGKPVRLRSGMARRLTLDRIRYYLYYRVDRDRIRLLILWHTSRRPPRL